MNRQDAIYARQSVEKKDSLSISGQVDLCRRMAGEKEPAVYRDAGYSGKNTERPAFRQLMQDVKAGRIATLYVYRLDRFSRSVADFGQLWQVLQANRVEFVSVSENFDTSTPMGRAMLHIIMVFAQRQRQTLQQERDRAQRRGEETREMEFAALTFAEKKAVAAQLIACIRLAGDTVEIRWAV